MLKKIVICAATLLMMICLSGCGEEKVEGSPDKAILAYAEIFMKGESENLAAAGISEEYAENIRGQMTEAFSESFKDVAPLNDASLNLVAQKFYSRFKDDIKFKATLKQADAKNPVVELTTTPPDQIGANRAAVNNDELIALIGMVGQLKADGATDEQLAHAVFGGNPIPIPLRFADELTGFSKLFIRHSHTVIINSCINSKFNSVSLNSSSNNHGRFTFFFLSRT